MKSEIIKSKHLIDRVLEIIEHKDDFGKIISYTVIMAIHGKVSIAGAGKLEEKNFSNIEEATQFFNDQK